MSQYRTDEEVRNFDIFKGVVTALLLITLFILAAMGYGSTGDQAAGPDEIAGQEESMEGEIAEAPAESAAGVPDLLSPAPGTALDSGPTTFSGMGTPGSQVAIVAGGTELGRTLIDENGTWELEVELPPGVESIELQAIDSSGSVVAGSEPIPMTSADSAAGQEEALETGGETEDVGTTEPAAPPSVNLPEEELYAGEPITLSGTGQPGTTLQLLANGEEAGSAVVAEDGTWTMEVELPEGDYEIDILVLDEAGAVVETVPAISIPVQAAEAPSFILPDLAVPNFNPLTGSLAWSGESAPGARVAAIVDDEIIDEAAADEAGQWNLNLDLEPGAYSLAFGQLDEEGNVTSSSEPVDIEVPGRLPQIDLPEGSLPGEVLDAIDSGEGEDALQTALNSIALSGITLPPGPIELAGTAEPGQEVALLINGEVAATAVADEEGNITLPADVTEAARTLQLGVVGDDGTLTAKSVEVNVATGTGEEAVAETPGEGEAEQPAEQPVEEPAEEPATGVSGTVTYTEDLTLPGNAVVSVQIIDISAGAATEILGEQTIELDDSQVPVPYEVPFNPEEIDEANLYGVTARIETADGTLLFVSETNTPVITDGNPTEDVEIVTAQVRSAAADAALGVADTELAESADTVLEVMENSGQFNILLEGLEEAGLADRLAQAGTYTVFAPTDEAFEAMPPGILAGWLFNPDEFGRILANMVVEGRYEPNDLTNGLVLRSILETNIGVQEVGDLITVNGIPIIDGALAGESYVYALPRVILPPLPAGFTAPSIDQAGVPIFTGDFLTVVGVGESGLRIVLTIDDEPFGRVATVDDSNFWQVEGDISPGIHNIVAYLIDDNGLLQAISNEVTLSVASP